MPHQFLSHKTCSSGSHFPICMCKDLCYLKHIWKNHVDQNINRGPYGLIQSINIRTRVTPPPHPLLPDWPFSLVGYDVYIIRPFFLLFIKTHFLIRKIAYYIHPTHYLAFVILYQNNNTGLKQNVHLRGLSIHIWFSKVSAVKTRRSVTLDPSITSTMLQCRMVSGGKHKNTIFLIWNEHNFFNNNRSWYMFLAFSQRFFSQRLSHNVLLIMSFS